MERGDQSKRSYLALATLALVIIAGCGGLLKSVYDMPAPERDKIISRTYENSPADVYDAYLSYFQVNGWPIDLPNKESGIITTGWKNINEVGGKGIKGTLLTAFANVRSRRKFTVSIAKLDDRKTKISITLIQEQADADKENWRQQIMNKKYLTAQLKEIFSAVGVSLKETVP